MILLTGASGFFGRIVKERFSSEIITLGRDDKSNIICDLSQEVPVVPSVEIVIHAAGKAHLVPKTAADKEDFFNVNVKGTQHLLSGLEKLIVLPKSIVLISSVSVYGLESGINISEDMPLGAVDPYGKSKIEAEKLVQNWCLKNGVICSILRLPLLVGQNPPGNLGAMIKSIKHNYYFNIAGGTARKSMVLVEDVSDILLTVASIGGVYNLTDGNHPSFINLSEKITHLLGKGQPMNIPFWMAKTMAVFGDLLGRKSPINSKKLKKITADLTFDDSRARAKLGWNPKNAVKHLSL
ncbi:NAD-dependent epimerase/dehydratase family protein [Pedobacter gandavensis]|uniref:NAD-dependent epimerase/dehydratase family protein n=1 Tax=Pedobacter gandavensis TaxID=2679963 RepID=A0ABR6EXJ0_9SPHI|nr:NAD-dependent epimerase/dehydratase family protein [Pedobacter gandavensis]MBB2149891.1 NAD-dependent epimerase/dehydratase family protein [Pedobacter gandavensis]